MRAEQIGEQAACARRAAVEALRRAVGDAQTVARYRSKVVSVPGSPCAWWSGAVSGRGHGRFWVTRADGRDVVIIAHRFGYALEVGVDALFAAPVLGHACDNPLVRREALVDRVEVRDLHRRPVAAGRLKLRAA